MSATLADGGPIGDEYDALYDKGYDDGYSDGYNDGDDGDYEK